jgi:hypothetical protein
MDQENQLAQLERRRQEVQRQLTQQQLLGEQHEQTMRQLHLCVYLMSVCCAVNEMRLTQMEEQIRPLQDRLRIRTQEMEDLQLRMDLLQEECNLYRATPFNLNRLQRDLAQMNQQLLHSQAYNQQQFNYMRFYQRENHETEILHLRRVEEELRSLFRNENSRPQQGNRDRRENILPQFLNAPTANRPKKKYYS